MSTDRQTLIEDIPYGAIVTVHGNEGSVVSYIERDLSIRSFTMSRRPYHWHPFFMVPHVSLEMERFLIDSLWRESPHADEVVVARSLNSDGSVDRFLWSIKHVL
jgi:hypothetical protein